MIRHTGLRRAIGVLATSGILTTAMAAVAAAPAAAATLTCGTTITHNLTLHRNLNCRTLTTSGTAITIGAANLTVNLNGHTITGPGVGVDAYGISDIGYNGLTIAGGTVTGFYQGVYVSGGATTPLTGIVVKHLTITAGQPAFNAEGYAIIGRYLRRASIHNLTISDCYYGIDLYGNTGSTISRIHVVSPEYGLEDQYGIGNTWAHDTVTGAIGDAFYIYLTARTAVRDNHLSGSGAVGVYDYEATGLSITGNTFGPMYDAIGDYYSTGTTAAHNKGTGDGWGIYSYLATGATYHTNTFNGGAFGIETDYPTNETLSANVTNRNSDAGVFVYTASTTSSYTAKLIHNTANGNRFGLYSQIPTTGYGNHAAHNKVLNCHNVACVKAAIRRATLLGAPVHLVPRAPRRPASGPPARRR